MKARGKEATEGHLAQFNSHSGHAPKLDISRKLRHELLEKGPSDDARELAQTALTPLRKCLADRPSLALPCEFADHAVDRLDGIGRVDCLADRRREFEHGRDVRPLQSPLLCGDKRAKPNWSRSARFVGSS
jgi:hypothetical protein